MVSPFAMRAMILVNGNGSEQGVTLTYPREARPPRGPPAVCMTSVTHRKKPALREAIQPHLVIRFVPCYPRRRPQPKKLGKSDGYQQCQRPSIIQRIRLSWPVGATFGGPRGGTRPPSVSENGKIPAEEYHSGGGRPRRLLWLPSPPYERPGMNLPIVTTVSAVCRECDSANASAAARGWRERRFGAIPGPPLSNGLSHERRATPRTGQ